VPRAGAVPVPGGPAHDTEEHHISEPRINDRIRVAEVRLVGPNGEQVGIVRVEDALRLAQDADLDLVEVAPDARPPVVKIMDFGKFKYEADMKAREARRNQANTVLKEIRFRLKIDPHDYGTKKGHVERFLKGGDKVKVMIMFRGREQSRPEMGVRLLQRLADDVAELGFIESMPRQDGRNMIMVLGPTKRKAEQRSEQRRAAQAEASAKQTSAPTPAVASAGAPVEQPAEPVSAPVVADEQPAAPKPATVKPAAPATTPTETEQPAAPASSARPVPRPSPAPRPPAPRPASRTTTSGATGTRSTAAPRRQPPAGGAG
jgi:translation initiation factor IF-3